MVLSFPVPSNSDKCSQGAWRTDYAVNIATYCVIVSCQAFTWRDPRLFAGPDTEAALGLGCVNSNHG